MKKIFCTLAALSMLTFGARADEGMWLLPLLQQLNGKALTDLGCRLTPDQIYSLNHSSLKDAIVSFGGGCTGEMISDNGLLVTNHHCGYGIIQKLSSPEHNYLEDGYWAMNNSEELPAPGLSVTFLENIIDITDITTKAYDAAMKKNKKDPNCERIAYDAMQAAANAYRDQVEGDYPGCRVTAQNFYNKNVYYIIVYKSYTDVRFVGAPPASLGKFGGETDNWMWPRQTCDFSMFRVYAGKDNQPAAYSKDNVPYSPKQSLKVSLKGVNDGDFTMIMGYPGSTQRFQTADQLELMLERNAVSVAARTVRQNVMWAGMEADPKVRLQYASKYAGSANGWKKWQGMELAVNKLDIIGREKRKEADYLAWIAADKKRQATYGGALEEISAVVAAQKEGSLASNLLSQTVSTIGPLSILNSVLRGYQMATRQPDADKSAAFAKALQSAAAAFKDYDVELEKKMAVAVLNHYRANAKPENYLEGIGDFANMDFSAYIDELFANSAFATKANLAGRGISSMEDVEKDPVYKLYNAIQSLSAKFRPDPSLGQRLELAAKKFTAGLIAWKGASYPDANSTMRLTYGQVKSYSPKDGVLNKHYTTLTGVIEKEDPDNYEFRVPAKIKELYAAKDFGQYANAAGELPACFLMNGDITGGNSGSPVLDADGALVGLAFDGNWESMSSDIMFEPDLQRCICVDIRYVLFVMDKFGGAGYLLGEMNLVK